MKYHYPVGKPKRIKVGDRFKTLTRNTYYNTKANFNQVFLIGCKVTFLGWRLDRVEPLWRWPKFKFDNDEHKERVLCFNELTKI